MPLSPPPGRPTLRPRHRVIGFLLVVAVALLAAANAAAAGRTLVVDAAAAPGGDGSEAAPFQRVNQAAGLAGPGDRVLVRPGVYRERVSPARGGTEGAPVRYEASEPGRVFLRGSEPFEPDWRPHPELGGVRVGPLSALPMGAEAYAGVLDPAVYGDFNPYRQGFNAGVVARPHAAVVGELRAKVGKAAAAAAEAEGTDDEARRITTARRLAELEDELSSHADPGDPLLRLTNGQLFADGAPLQQVQRASELAANPESWMVDPAGEALWVHLDPRLGDPAGRRLEATVRHTVFSPLTRGLGHVHVEGFVIEHASNPFPTWGRRGWPQVGALSTRSGHHWVIRNNLVRHAAGIGVDCGAERDRQVNIEFKGDSGEFAPEHQAQRPENIGHHLIEFNDISDNGHCGLAGNRHVGTVVRRNRVERNNADGWTSPWWEFGGIKFHFFWDGVIEENLIRDNEAHGVWLDHKWAGSRVTRNVILNNKWSGVNVELGRGPALIDHNVIAHTRQGDGVYGHDVADVTIAHNLLYANANFGVWFAFATPRVKPEDGCRDIHTHNNLILGNRAGAIAYPLPWDYAGNNTSDGNLFQGAGQYLDEGSGPRGPSFVVTNDTHMGRMGFALPEGVTAQTPEAVVANLQGRLRAAGVPEEQWPDADAWPATYRLGLSNWRAATGNDRHSAVNDAIRDDFNTRRLSWEFRFGDALGEVVAEPVRLPAGLGEARLDRDFHGRPLPPEGLRPGPFQSLDAGLHRVNLGRGYGVNFAVEAPR